MRRHPGLSLLALRLAASVARIPGVVGITEVHPPKRQQQAAA